jgi:hypothetical protein
MNPNNDRTGESIARFSIAAVPEPSSMLLAAVGALAMLRRRRVEQPPFPRPPVRPIGSFRGLPQKAKSLQQSCSRSYPPTAW